MQWDPFYFVIKALKQIFVFLTFIKGFYTKVVCMDGHITYHTPENKITALCLLQPSRLICTRSSTAPSQTSKGETGLFTYDVNLRTETSATSHSLVHTWIIMMGTNNNEYISLTSMSYSHCVLRYKINHTIFDKDNTSMVVSFETLANVSPGWWMFGSMPRWAGHNVRRIHQRGN